MLVDTVYLDFSKAFDKVSHYHLLCKLRDRGVPHQLVNWIASYLSLRRQRVRLQNYYSDWISVQSGVPQGSVLGPLLFNLYVDDLDSVLPEGLKVKKFADDTKIYCIYSLDEAAESANRLQQGLECIELWCHTWQMQLNVAKCSVMYFGSRNPCARYSLRGKELSCCDHQRDLGVVISRTACFSEHCLRTAASARRMTGLVFRTFRSRHLQVMLPLFKSIVRPILEYCTVIWNPHLQKDVDEIESVQRKFTKQISGIRTLTYDCRLDMLNLPTLASRRDYFDLLECYKLVRGLVRSECSQSVAVSHTSTRGHDYKLVPMHHTPRLNIRKQFLTERVLRLWNALPHSIVELDNYSQFKAALKRHLNV